MVEATGVRVVAGERGLDRPSAGCTSPSCRDPTPWLSGGELLLTTGMAVADDGAEYVARIAGHGLAGLGVGVKVGGLEAVPPEMAAAADAPRLPALRGPVRDAVHRAHREGVHPHRQRAGRAAAAGDRPRTSAWSGSCCPSRGSTASPPRSPPWSTAAPRCSTPAARSSRATTRPRARGEIALRLPVPTARRRRRPGLAARRPRRRAAHRARPPGRPPRRHRRRARAAAPPDRRRHRAPAGRRRPRQPSCPVSSRAPSCAGACSRSASPIASRALVLKPPPAARRPPRRRSPTALRARPAAAWPPAPAR